MVCQVIKRASRAHEYFAAIDSTGEYKRTPVMTRSGVRRVTREFREFEMNRFDTVRAYVAHLCECRNGWSCWIDGS
jgi:hypothetical protein